LETVPGIPEPEHCVHLADMVHVVDELLVPQDSMLVASRIVHHNSRKKQAAFWQGCGRFLSGSGHFASPPMHRRIVITNPEARDNEEHIAKPGEVDHSGAYKWKSVKPFNTDEVLEQISQAAAGHKAYISRQSDTFEVFQERFRNT